MDLHVNELVVHPGLEPPGRVIRVAKVERWPVVAGVEIVENVAARCHGTMIVFDRVVPVPPAPVGEFRLAHPEEISEAARLGLLPPTIDGRDDGRGGSGRSEQP